MVVLIFEGNTPIPTPHTGRKRGEEGGSSLPRLAHLRKVALTQLAGERVVPSGHLQLLRFGEVVGFKRLPQLLEEFTVLVFKPVRNSEVLVFVVQSEFVESEEVLHMAVEFIFRHLKANLSVGVLCHWLVEVVVHSEGVGHHHGHIGGSVEDSES